MDNHCKRAEELFKSGYNCAQSVFCSFCEDVGMDFETALKLSSSFGGGMGRLREVCGAVSAMFMIAGLKYGYTEATDDKIKEEHYRRIQTLAELFQQKHGSIICRELLGLKGGKDTPVPSKRTKEYYTSRPCEEIVKNSAQIMEEYINTITKNVS